MLKFFTFEDPFYIFLVVTLIISSLTTSNKYLFILNTIILVSFSYAMIFTDDSYIDAYILIIFTIVILIYKIREKLAGFLYSKHEVNFSGIEKYVYDRDFKQLFTEKEFKMFISFAELKKIQSKGALACEGTRIEKIIYVATIPEYKSLTLESRDVIISYLHEGSWLGVIEFIKHLSETSEENWLVSLNLIKNVVVVYFEWDFVSLTNLFKHSTDFKFVNKLLLIWCKYLSTTINRMDDHISNALKAMIEDDLNAKDNANPLKRYITRLETHESDKFKNEYSDIAFDNRLKLGRKKSNLNKVGMDLSEMKI